MTVANHRINRANRATLNDHPKTNLHTSKGLKAFFNKSLVGVGVRDRMRMDWPDAGKMVKNPATFSLDLTKTQLWSIFKNRITV